MVTSGAGDTHGPEFQEKAEGLTHQGKEDLASGAEV